MIYRVGFAVKDDEPVEYALSTVKSCINNIWDRFPDREYQALYLTGKNNFRDKIATIQVYKGNRDPSHKPKYYSEIKDYMMEHHKAYVVPNMEAEDMCGIEQFKHKDKSTVIVGVDKDLLCIPGYHYNPVKDVLSYVTINEANTHFWKQVLTGDRTDNIRGIDGLGPKTADKLIDPCAGDWMKMRDVTLQQYYKQHGDDAERAMKETATLIWILREEGRTFDGTSIAT